MYCTKCGKEIDSGIICKDCLEREVAQNPETEEKLKEEAKLVFGSEQNAASAEVEAPVEILDPVADASADPVSEAEVLPAMDPENEAAESAYIALEPEIINETKGEQIKEKLDLDEIIWNPDCKSIPFCEPVENTDKMLGFGRALASVILGSIGYVVAFISYMFAYLGDEIVEGEPELALVMLIVALALNIAIALPISIISLVNGTKSIKLFKKTVGKKPVATLVLGIIGTYSSACALIMLLTSLIYI